MSTNEANALTVHNRLFTKPACNLVETDAVHHRFYVEFADGSFKHDYECGSAAVEIAAKL